MTSTSFTKKRILVTGVLFESALKILEDYPSFTIDVVQGKEPWSKEELLERAKGVAGIVSLWPQGRIIMEIIRAASPTLQVVSVDSIGYNYLDTQYLKDNHIRLGNAGKSQLSDATAEIGVHLIIGACRRTSIARKYLEEGNWSGWSGDLQFFGGVSLLGKTVGFLGFGNVGFGIAKRLSGFGLRRIIYHSRTRKEEAEAFLAGIHGADYCGYIGSLDDVLQAADVFVVATDLNPSTEGLINYQKLQLLKSNSVLVNVGRGAIIVQDDLIRSLREGKPAAAGLDVMTPEPLPLNSELLQFPQVILLPHMGGDCAEPLSDAQTSAVRNVVECLSDKPMFSEVTLR
ncbi:hypothetical protein HDU93_007268 [Gonapodya sp. JEL0774]|nr:hypothetical protein HDU93_007268 [Gonapodya sp. JEL0774]